jgi:hypothetical protein
MNQDQVKEKLLQLRPDVAEFTLVFSGKASKKVNGLYHPETCEIIIHNKNFEDDNALMYTAIHEYAHHVHRGAGGPVSQRAHTVEFRAIFHQLLEEAEAKGLYTNVVEKIDELRSLAEEIRARYVKTNGELMKDFGQTLMEAEKLCRKHNARFEDFIERALRLPKATASTLMKIKALDLPPDLGYENMKTLAGIRSNEVRAEATEAFLEGDTPDQIKQALASRPAETTRKTDPRKKLASEKKRIEKALAGLQERLAEIETELEELGPEPLPEAPSLG